MSTTPSNVEAIPIQPDRHSLPFSSLIPALSFALDLTEGRPMGHVLRTCAIGMRIAEQIHLPKTTRSISTPRYC
jgi:hypothetical protein